MIRSKVGTLPVVFLKERDVPPPPCPASHGPICGGETLAMGELKVGVWSLTPCGHSAGSCAHMAAILGLLE